MRVDDSAMAQELEERFRIQLSKAIAEAYSQGMPELASTLDLTKDYMSRSRDETVKRLRSLGVFSFPPEVYHTLLDLAAKQTVQLALERVEQERKENENTLLSKKATKWAIPLSIGSICVGILAIAIETSVQLWLRLHH